MLPEYFKPSPNSTDDSRQLRCVVGSTMRGRTLQPIWAVMGPSPNTDNTRDRVSCRRASLAVEKNPRISIVLLKQGMSMRYYKPEAYVSKQISTELVVGFVHQTQSLVANPRNQRSINRYLIPLKSFRIVDRRDIRAGESTARRRVSELQSRGQALPRSYRLPQKP